MNIFLLDFRRLQNIDVNFVVTDSWLERTYSPPHHYGSHSFVYVPIRKFLDFATRYFCLRTTAHTHKLMGTQIYICTHTCEGSSQNFALKFGTFYQLFSIN